MVTMFMKRPKKTAAVVTATSEVDFGTMSYGMNPVITAAPHRNACASLGRHSGTKNRTTRGAEFAHVCGAGRRWRVCGAGRRWRGGTVLARPVIRKLTIAQVLFGLHCVGSPENVREVFAHAADSIHGVVKSFEV